MDEATSGLKHYCVPILGLFPQVPETPVGLNGSGTLVEIEGTHHILTAAHVWNEIKDAEHIGFPLTEQSAGFMIERDNISEKLLWNPNGGEWGPDLALLRLPLPSVSTIEARKSFLNLAKQKTTFAASHAQATEKRFWAVIGMVEQFSEVQPSLESGPTQVDIQMRAFFSIISKTHQRDGYDYFDLSAKLGLPGVPSTFAGVSGGGLWEIRLLIKESGEIVWDEKRHFRGLVFGQTPEANGRRLIRCHGPQSIFERAWESWGLA